MSRLELPQLFDLCEQRTKGAIIQFKKLSALILSFALCFNLCSPAFAAETDLPEESEPLILQGAAIAASIVQATTATANLVVQSASQAPSLFINLLDEFCTFDEDVQALYGSGRRFAQAIAEASSISDVGDVIITGVMNGKIYRFVEWFIDKFSLVPGGSDVSVPDFYIYRFNDGLYLPLFYSPVFNPKAKHNIVYIGPSFQSDVWYQVSEQYSIRYDSASGNLQQLIISSGTVANFFYIGRDKPMILCICRNNSYGYCLYVGYTDNGIISDGTIFLTDLRLGDGLSKGTLSFSPKNEFQELPSEIPDNQGLTIDTGISGLDTSNPQTTADTIFQFIINGDYAPTVSVGEIPVTYDPQIIASQFSVTSTTFTSSISLTGLDPSHEYKPFWSLYNKADLTQVIASGYAAEIGTVTGVGSFSGYSQVINLMPSTAYLINWTLLDVTANEIAPSVSNVEFTTSADASSDDSPGILLMILNKVSAILDKMNGGQSEGILASINEKLDALVETLANSAEKSAEESFQETTQYVGDTVFGDESDLKLSLGDVGDMASVASTGKNLLAVPNTGVGDFLGLFSSEYHVGWFSQDTRDALTTVDSFSVASYSLEDTLSKEETTWEKHQREYYAFFGLEG